MAELVTSALKEIHASFRRSLYGHVSRADYATPEALALLLSVTDPILAEYNAPDCLAAAFREAVGRSVNPDALLEPYLRDSFALAIGTGGFMADRYCSYPEYYGRKPVGAWYRGKKLPDPADHRELLILGDFMAPPAFLQDGVILGAGGSYKLPPVGAAWLRDFSAFVREEVYAPCREYKARLRQLLASLPGPVEPGQRWENLPADAYSIF